MIWTLESLARRTLTAFPANLVLLANTTAGAASPQDPRGRLDARRAVAVDAARRSRTDDAFPHHSGLAVHDLLPDEHAGFTQQHATIAQQEAFVAGHTVASSHVARSLHARPRSTAALAHSAHDRMTLARFHALAQYRDGPQARAAAAGSSSNNGPASATPHRDLFHLDHSLAQRAFEHEAMPDHLHSRARTFPHFVGLAAATEVNEPFRMLHTFAALLRVPHCFVLTVGCVFPLDRTSGRERERAFAWANCKDDVVRSDQSINSSGKKNSKILKGCDRVLPTCLMVERVFATQRL